MPSHVDIWFGGLRSDSVTDTASYEFSMPTRQLVPVCSSSHQSIIKVRFGEKKLGYRKQITKRPILTARSARLFEENEGASILDLRTQGARKVSEARMGIVQVLERSWKH